MLRPLRSRPPRRWRGAFLAVLVAAQGVSFGVLAHADDAKTHLAAADKAARGKDWATALTEYAAANKAQPSADALEGVANAEYQQKHDAEAYVAYDDYLKEYASKVPAAKKALAAARLKELGDKTGLLTIEVSEAGATIVVDDKPVGTSPLAQPIRLAAGPHRVRVTKDGFLPFDQAPNVAGGAGAGATGQPGQTVQVKLEAQANKGRLVVKEKTGQAIRVFVDGVDMGEAPWSGEVAAGEHEIVGRSPSLGAPAQKVVVERGKTADIEIVASSSTTPIKIATSDGKGTIYLDDRLVGEGTFASEVPAGSHKIRITREGYDSFEEQVDLKPKEPLVRSVTLKLSSKIETGPILKESRRIEGLYGGVNVGAMFLPSGMKSSPQTLCAGDHPAELASCDEGGGIGAGVNGFIGYHWDPIGVELFLGAQYDDSSPKLEWAASSTDPGIGPDPARTEDFAIKRGGGFGMFRIRLTLQGEKLRFSAAAGVGLAYSVIVMKRETRATADPNVKSLYVSDTLSYLSPALSFEPALYYRLGPTLSAGLGFSILVESSRAFNQTPSTTADGTQRLGPSGLTTPSYDLTTGPQVFVGPFIGMMFGP